MRKGRYFELTEEHIKLLRHTYVRWDDTETGAPQIDPKRPYGNSDVFTDVAEILGLPVKYEWGSEEEASLRALHKETETALQIVLATGEFVPGLYHADDYRINWSRVESAV